MSSRRSRARKGIPIARRTLKQPVTLSGVGLHTGAHTEAHLLPATSGQGIAFRRTDLADKPLVPARLTEVEALERRTAIGHGDATIHTVEHLLSALGALEVDDCIIELSGPEPPALDGSVGPYFKALMEAGTADHDGEPVLLTVQAPFTVTEGDASYVVAPAKSYRLTATVEFAHPMIGRQAGTYEITPEAFAKELANARTFGFASEGGALRAKGLIKAKMSAAGSSGRRRAGRWIGWRRALVLPRGMSLSPRRGRGMIMNCSLPCPPPSGRPCAPYPSAASRRARA